MSNKGINQFEFVNQLYLDLITKILKFLLHVWVNCNLSLIGLLFSCPSKLLVKIAWMHKKISKGSKGCKSTKLCKKLTPIRKQSHILVLPLS